MEERSWDLRLAEAREQLMELDPTLTERELLRDQSSLEPSAYGKNVFEDFDDDYRLPILNNNNGHNNDPDERNGGRQYTCTDQEIQSIEAFGVKYDPYYDDPYTEEELPSDEGYDHVRVDKVFGDHVYVSRGTMEIFYKDKDSGLFYRQGSRPRTDPVRNK